MTKSQLGFNKGKIRASRAQASLFFRRRHSSRHRGQTLTEYVLLLAYISVFAIQTIQYVGFVAQKEYVITNCSIMLGNMQNKSQAVRMLAVITYLSDPHTWGNANPDWVAPANVQIMELMASTIYGS